ALTEYADLQKNHPKDVQVKKNYIQILIVKNQIEEARKLNDEILAANANDVEGLIYRGQIQIRSGQFREAGESLQTAIKNDPKDGMAYYHLGIAFEQLKDFSRAEGAWQNAIATNPDLVEGHKALANAAARTGDMAALGRYANQLIRLLPTLPDGFL